MLSCRLVSFAMNERIGYIPIDNDESFKFRPIENCLSWRRDWACDVVVGVEVVCRPGE
jgi:hypothetical protein